MSLDYNPTVSAVLQLVRLLQAEFESASLSSEAAMPEKKARAAAMQPAGPPDKPKAPPPKSSGPSVGDPQSKGVELSGEVKGKVKGKEEGKETSRP